MATEYLTAKHTAGLTVYFRFIDPSNDKVFDFNDDTWAANVGAATTPKLSGTEKTDFGDADQSYYIGSYDFSDLNATTTAIEIIIQAMDDLATDEIITEAEAFVVSGVLLIRTDALAAIGTPVALDGGSATIAGMLTKLADDNDGGDFDAATDSQEAIANTVGVAGTGYPTATITIKETDTNGAVIPNVRVAVYDAANAVYVNEGTTNGSGIATIIIPGGDATYKARLYLAGYTFTIPETLTVSGDTADEYYGTQFTPGTPSPGTVRIYSWEFASDGVTAIEGVDVHAWPSDQGAHHDDGGIAYDVSTYKVTATTDSDGAWSMDLSPAIEYDFDLRTSRDKIYRKLTTPAANSQLEDIDGIDD